MDEQTPSRAPATKPRTKFSVELIESLANDLRSGRTPIDRMTVSDDVVPGLRAIVRHTGLISLHVNYAVGGARPYLKLGDHPDMKIVEARELARTIQALAAKGIDPQEGLHDRLIRELRAKGTKWRP